MKYTITVIGHSPFQMLDFERLGLEHAWATARAIWGDRLIEVRA